jgi:hypothetical protein
MDITVHFVNLIAAIDRIHCDFIGLQENTGSEDNLRQKYQVGKQ